MKTISSKKIFYKLKNKSGKHIKYFDIYDSLFKKYINKKITIVEIGVLNGGSLHLWREFFGKNAKIIGVDINPEVKIFEKDGFEIFIGNQSDKKFWNNFFKKVGMVDIIIDDGGHTNEQQIITFSSCVHKIKNGGLLLVEDVNTSYMKEFLNPQKYSFINFCKKVIDDINLSSPILKNNFYFSYSKYVYAIEFFESIVVFKIDRKKTIKNLEVANSGINYNIKDLRHTENKQIMHLKEKIFFFQKFFLIKEIILFLRLIISFLRKNINNKKIKKYFT
jgi:23S rRNA U2552 (ribose-2'-O)-methylase RlmE/FtsJ